MRKCVRSSWQRVADGRHWKDVSDSESFDVVTNFSTIIHLEVGVSIGK